MAYPAPDAARATAAEGWIWGFALLENYRTLYAQAIDADDPRYVGGFGRFRHYPQPFTPANTDIVTPNNDTPYSWGWLDLRAEPWVVSVPALGDRYYVLPFHDLDTVYAGLVGSRTTGPGSGDHLIAGPDWNGETPDGISSVVRCATQLVGTLGRTYLAGPDDVGTLKAIQEQYSLRPLSQYTGAEAPAPAPEPAWPIWRDTCVDSIEFFTVLDFLLAYFPVRDDVRDLRERLAALGVDGTGTFEPGALPDQLRDAIEHGITDGRDQLEEAKGHTSKSVGLFGTREQLGTDFLSRAVGVDKGIYGLPAEEAWYGGWTVDSEGNRPPDAARHDYTIHFPADALPPARFFWSATMYALPSRLLAANPIDRYSIGDRTPALHYADDGSLTLHVQKEQPEDPAQAANWLPAPDGPFSVIIRMYGPGPAVLDGSWTLPPLTVQS
ncbi:DUF1254 domain-containing protein [Streptomyces sp. NPDC056568]|uniref:DUF1254 domain-containing protein n=1 Tax=Streptomyces sp. NPDC056568 TaxID=3345866 RepID=UPI0036A54F37